MKAKIALFFQDMNARLRQVLIGPQLLAFVPAAALAAYWMGGEPVLVLVTLGAPVLLLIVRPLQFSTSPSKLHDPDFLSGQDLEECANQSLLRARAANLSTAIFVLEAEGFDDVERSSGIEAACLLRELTLSRLRNMCRRDDDVYRIGENRFALLLGPSLRLDLETMMQQANRLQTGLEEPAPFESATHYLSVSLGFCDISKFQTCTGRKLLDAATTALGEALANGPSAIRSWSESMTETRAARKTLLNEVQRAMANGQIQPWFQPQVCTSTGRISGVEALARWIHPDRGVVPPGEFLHCLEHAGLMDRLSEVVLHQSLSALRQWDAAGVDIPRVSVNFSSSELRNPHLVERVKWELDRFSIEPSRLGVEVLETVIAGSPKGVTVHNITELGKFGCLIDLDDFGTGHTSITTLRRFTVHRLKIDRSFVTRIDRDEEQRRMFAAVLGLADRLGLATLAEGVETTGEHALLSQLGCDHVQGFGIARPMPAEQIVDWAQKHEAQVLSAQWQGRNLG